MLLTTLFSFAAWIVPTFASPDIDNMRVGQSEFRMGAILPRQQDQGQTNLQVFSGALGGAGAPAITNSGDPDRPFQVEGDTFVCHLSPSTFFLLDTPRTVARHGRTIDYSLTGCPTARLRVRREQGVRQPKERMRGRGEQRVRSKL